MNMEVSGLVCNSVHIQYFILALQISTAFKEQVRYHGNDESVWLMWAKWEVEDRGNFDRARTILLSKASLYHPKSLVISREVTQSGSHSFVFVLYLVIKDIDTVLITVYIGFIFLFPT